MLKEIKKYEEMNLIDMESIERVISEGEIYHIEIRYDYYDNIEEYDIYINHELCGWRYSMVDAIELSNLLFKYIYIQI